MSKEEAIEILKGDFSKVTLGEGECHADVFSKAFDMAMDALEKQEVYKWIHVSERLPETDDLMLVSCRTKKGVNSVNRAYYSNGAWHGSGSMSGVIAWMPLPEPYKGEAE